MRSIAATLVACIIVTSLPLGSPSLASAQAAPCWSLSCQALEWSGQMLMSGVTTRNTASTDSSGRYSGCETDISLYDWASTVVTPASFFHFPVEPRCGHVDTSASGATGINIVQYQISFTPIAIPTLFELEITVTISCASLWYVTVTLISFTRPVSGPNPRMTKTFTIDTTGNGVPMPIVGCVSAAFDSAYGAFASATFDPTCGMGGGAASGCPVLTGINQRYSLLTMKVKFSLVTEYQHPLCLGPKRINSVILRNATNATLFYNPPAGLEIDCQGCSVGQTCPIMVYGMPSPSYSRASFLPATGNATGTNATVQVAISAHLAATASWNGTTTVYGTEASSNLTAGQVGNQTQYVDLTWMFQSLSDPQPGSPPEPPNVVLPDASTGAATSNAAGSSSTNSGVVAAIVVPIVIAVVILIGVGVSIVYRRRAASTEPKPASATGSGDRPGGASRLAPAVEVTEFTTTI